MAGDLATALESAAQQAQTISIEQTLAILLLAASRRPEDVHSLLGIVLVNGLGANTPSAQSIAQLLPLDLLYAPLALPNPPRLELWSVGAQTPGALAPTPAPHPPP